MNLRASPLVQMTDEARRPSRWWLAWLVTMVIFVVVPPLGIAVGNAVLGAPASTNVWYPYVGAFGALATLLVIFVWVKFKEGRAFATVGFRAERGWVRLLAGFGIGAGMISAVVALGLVVGVYRNGLSTHTLTGVDAVLPLLPLAVLCLLQAICQAALAPGYLVQMSARQLPGWVAIIGTSILVTVLHTLNPLSMLNLFLYSTFAALVALQQGSLWLVAGIQGGWSCFHAGVFGLPVGGFTQPSSLLSLGPMPGTSTLIGGGHFGLETGLLATVLLGVATVIAYLRLRRTTKVAADISPTAASSTPSRRDHAHVTHGI